MASLGNFKSETSGNFKSEFDTERKKTALIPEIWNKLLKLMRLRKVTILIIVD